MHLEIVDEGEHVFVVKPKVELLDEVDGEKILKKIELCGRTAYKSENLITQESAKNFIKRIIEHGHESVIEHAAITVKVACDRGITHEIVRHRIASYTQESTRYCNYSKEKFGKKVWVIMPCFLELGGERYKDWLKIVDGVAGNYLALLSKGWKPEEARSVLPNAVKAEICMTMNLREWRHFFKLRCSKEAHPQMREIANMILRTLHEKVPIVFDDLYDTYIKRVEKNEI